MGSHSPYRMKNSILNSYVKELKNTDTKKVNNDIKKEKRLKKKFHKLRFQE